MSVEPLTRVETIVETLERDGIVVVPDVVGAQELAEMQRAFDNALQHPSWNSWRGYEQSNKYRRMVEDILTLDPAFQQVALNASVREIMSSYIGPEFVLSEVRGWETIATRQDFHGWHNDAWYDHALPEVPRELKLGLYLTDVESGYFSYIKGSHVGTRHRHWNDRQLADVWDRKVDMTGPAGSTFIFDTAGIHRQSVPVLSPRRAIMFNYHNPAIPLQEIDRLQYRYAPLLLNAAFLGGMSEEERRVLGFGDQSTYRRHYRSPRRYGGTHGAFRRLFDARLEIENVMAFVRTAVDAVKRRVGLGS